MKKYYGIRIGMHEYIKKLFEEAHTNGSPLLRAMFYEFPDDERCWELQDQYMFGGDVLVAPIVYENTCEREVYLPQGAEWTLISDGTKYEGGRTVKVSADISQIPVFLRDGRHEEWVGCI